MPYILSIAIVAIAVLLGIFTGVWSGFVWIVAVAIVLAAVFALRARDAEVRTASTAPIGRPRAGGPASGTANERVGEA